ncbi:hypothetical protein SAMN05421841_2511 [Chryseobacterium wanjuense]|jgi:hypothetical protein|uniref:Uncharacterized protein n=1 Tax=Chryseobacterium wanjuense TaxID=356305 RepID=A0A1I0RF13_9FLAO|nr:hypothetical protein SAMN05421841_2511 [Chryseobacterium wanjuense]
MKTAFTIENFNIKFDLKTKTPGNFPELDLCVKFEPLRFCLRS